MRRLLDSSHSILDIAFTLDELVLTSFHDTGGVVMLALADRRNADKSVAPVSANVIQNYKKVLAVWLSY